MSQTLKKENSNQDSTTIPVIGIGASAGGLEAFSQFVEGLIPNSGIAYVLIQHLAPEKESLLRNILSHRAMIPITEIIDETVVEPNHIYVSPPASFVTINRGILKLRPFTGNIHPKTIDHFLISLAEDLGQRAVGAIFSGTGSDGTEGLRAIKENGGITFAQDPETTQFPEMPQCAIAAGVVDYVYPPTQVAKELPMVILEPKIKLQADEAEFDDQTLNEIFDALKRRFRVDFTRYSKPTIYRRLFKRMTLHRIKKVEEYASLLRDDAAEVEALYREILINVTSFFRDSKSFEALVEKALPRIYEGRAPDDVLRVWVPGCSTGEEAYSLAILFIEYFDEKKLGTKLQIFATDIDDDALKVARAGLYKEEIAKHVSPERLNKFFDKQADGYKVCKRVRDPCVFARHDVLSDPPFARLNLISCRNTLIYIKDQQQRLMLQGFHYALAPDGILFLGTSETVGRATNLFSVIDKKYKIYLKKPGPSRPDYLFAPKFTLPTINAGVRKRLAGIDPLEAIKMKADEIVLSEYAPAGVVVNEDLEILQFRGKTGRFLEPAPGAPSFNIMRMVREPLSLRLHIAFEKAKKENIPVAERGILKEVNGSSRSIGFEVRPFKVQQSTERVYIILFEDSGDRKDSVKEAEGEPLQAQVSSIDEFEAVKRELVETQEYLKIYIEEQEALSEEFKSTLEELQSNYEELQSTSEELETAKEELQTSNEEMNTLNEELQNRNLELGQLNDDLNNLISSTRIPIVMVGGDMRIRMVSPFAEKLLGVLPGDMGRLIGDLNLRVAVPELERLISETMRDLRVSEVEVKDREGNWFMLRLNPYRTVENHIDGAVVSFIDTTELKKRQLEALDAKRYAENIVETLRNPLMVLDSDLRVVSTNKSFYKMFKLHLAEVTNKLVYELDDNQWDIPELRLLLEQVLPKKSSFEGFEVDHVFPSIGRRVLLLNGRQVFQEVIGKSLILLEFEDITERRQIETQLKDYTVNIENRLEEKTKELIEAETMSAAGKVAAMIGHDLRSPIQAIKGNVYQLRKSPEKAEERLKAIDDAANRMAAMVEELRSKIRDTPLAVQAVDLADLAGLCLKETPVPPGVKTQLVVGAELDSVILDPSKIRRVLDNLVRNAVEAMPEGGNLAISAERVGSEAVIKVSDTGVGIP
ncbi:PAS domain-containing protein, partial [Candidatus Bathyarchaeota archaeon]|nr:PAS domain-containing protein [Candidatus Bathyarchaeota archaeon]